MKKRTKEVDRAILVVNVPSNGPFSQYEAFTKSKTNECAWHKFSEISEKRSAFLHFAFRKAIRSFHIFTIELIKIRFIIF